MNLDAKLKKLREENARLIREKQISTKPKAKKLSFLTKKQGDNALAKKELKLEQSAEKKLLEVQKLEVKSLVNTMEISDERASELSYFIDSFEAWVLECQIEKQRKKLDVPCKTTVSIEKETVKNFRNAFPEYFNSKDTPVLEAISIAESHLETRLNTIKSNLYDLDYYDAFQNSQEEKDETEGSSTYGKMIIKSNSEPCDDETPPWYLRSGNKGVKIHAVRTNKVVSEAYRGVRFPNEVKKEKKAQASI